MSEHKRYSVRPEQPARLPSVPTPTPPPAPLCPNCTTLRERVNAAQALVKRLREASQETSFSETGRYVYRRCAELLEEALSATPTPPTDAAPPLTIQRLKRHMATLTFVQWDRYVQTAHHVAVYGWIPRPDGRTDFVLIDLDDRGPMWWTSSAEHSAEIGRLLDGEGHHVDCKRVEEVVDLPNVVRLKPPTDAVTCPDCEGKVWRKLEVRVGEPGILHSPEPCPTCQPSPRPDAATCPDCGGSKRVETIIEGQFCDTDKPGEVRPVYLHARYPCPNPMHQRKEGKSDG